MQKQTGSCPNSSTWNALLNRKHGHALALVCVAVWLHAGDSLIVATMLPSIVADVGGGNLVSWAFILYALASVISGAASALMVLAYGIRLPMFWSALLFGTGCLISAIADSMTVVLLGRALQGMGGGVLVSLGFIAARQLFPTDLLPKVMASVSTLWGASAFLGPLLGGLFVEYANWRWGFAAFALQALALAAFIGVQKAQISTPAELKVSVPWLGLTVLTMSVIFMALASVEVQLVRSTALILVSLGLGMLFLKIDATSGTARMLPDKPFDIRTPVGATLLMVACFCAATVTNTIYGTLLLTRIYGVSALVAGYIIAFTAFGWSIAAFMVNGVGEESDPKLIVLGMTAVAASLVLFLIFYPIGPISLLALIGLFGGGGFGMAWTFILRRATSFVEEGEIPRVTAAITTVQRIGYTFGAAYIGLVANAIGFEHAVDPEKFGDMARLLFTACLPFAAVGLVATYVFALAKHTQVIKSNQTTG